MTLEQANESALAAAEAGDLLTLEQALHFRAQALAHLKHAPPSEQLAERMVQALKAGESIEQAVCALKQRIGFETARLTQLESGLTAGLGVSRRTRISYCG